MRAAYAFANVSLRMPTYDWHVGDRTSTYQAAHDAIESQLDEHPASDRHLLLCGGKKTLVWSSRSMPPGTLQIWGGLDMAGGIVQGLSYPPAHASTFVDYSHELRLVSRRATLDGAPIDLHAVYRDPVLSAAVSDEDPGPFDPDLLWSRVGSLPPGGAPAASAIGLGGRIARGGGALAGVCFLAWLAARLVRRR
jgi:hypothetical protein